MCWPAEEFNQYFVSVGEETACASANLASRHELNISEVTCTIRQKQKKNFSVSSPSPQLKLGR